MLREIVMESITFETDRFNLSEEKENFINPCCFGEDFALWLKPHLEAEGIFVSDIYQEDWGWEISCKYEGNSYYLGLGGTPEAEGTNRGKWRVIFSKRRSLIQSLLGKNKLSAKEPIIKAVTNIIKTAGIQGLSQEPA